MLPAALDLATIGLELCRLTQSCPRLTSPARSRRAAGLQFDHGRSCICQKRPLKIGLSFRPANRSVCARPKQKIVLQLNARPKAFYSGRNSLGDFVSRLEQL